MSYRAGKISAEEAYALLCLQTFALVYRYDGIEIIDTPEAFMDVVRDPECYEARFFSEASEIHMIDDCGNRMFFYLSDSNEETAETGKNAVFAELVEQSYKIANRFNPWKKVRIKEYLVPDQEDGQMCIAATRAAGLEK